MPVKTIVVGQDDRLGACPDSRKLQRQRLVSHLYMNAIIFLPRQARDKHRENSKKEMMRLLFPLAAMNLDSTFPAALKASYLGSFVGVESVWGTTMSAGAGAPLSHLLMFANISEAGYR